MPMLGFGHQVSVSEQRKQRPFDGFQSAEHRLAGLFVWRFRTQAATPTQSKPAKATSVSPAPGSEVPVLTFVDIQFDQPMAPPADASPYLVDQSDEEKPGMTPRMIPHVEYDAAKRVFRLPLLLPPKAKVKFTLTGFRNADGVPAEPIKLNYQVTREELAAATRAKAEADAKDPQLLALLETVRQKRAQLHSLAERVQTLSLTKDRGVFVRLDSKSAAFQWQHPDRFYGDASEMMMTCAAFRIGSNGRDWWWHCAGGSGKPGLVVCPANHMHKRYVSFCDPFELARRTPAQAAADLGLRLVDLNQGENPASHLLEAWVVDFRFEDFFLMGAAAFADFRAKANDDEGARFGDFFLMGRLTQWRIDAQTCRPVEVKTFYEFGVTRDRFHYDTVNEPLPAAAFAVPRLEGVSPTPPEALDADYTNRFINLRDGSDGILSVRWGKKGPQGVHSSGLN
jgi:hypothetical protein